MAGYGDNAGFTAYAEAAGYVVPDGTTAPQITAARQRGSMVIDRYEKHFNGRRTGGFAQERAWPRVLATTYWGKQSRLILFQRPSSMPLMKQPFWS